jgi:hypothetical protein
MGNVYWAGALPGLLLATAVSVGLALSLDRAHLRHVLWLVPALHFSGAFALGPALSLTYDLLVVTALGPAAPWAWLGGSVIVVGVVPALWARRGKLPARKSNATLVTCIIAALIVGAIVPALVALFTG